MRSPEKGGVEQFVRDNLNRQVIPV